MNIVLFEPEIPQNTGNIARTCVVTNCSLHLIKPLGFSISEKQVKRAGLDYWEFLDLQIYEDYKDFMQKNLLGNKYYFTTKAKKTYVDIDYQEDDYLIFGPESRGIPEEILIDNYDASMRIPMGDKFRSLNLSNAVAIVTYEALRQLEFPNMSLTGQLSNS
ncbi:MAG: tRNA (cytidine(34)-2'-O)-methyltransferase [Clostridia bacterium]